MVYVSKIYLPEKEKYKAYIDEIYKSGWVTNNGPLVQELEKKLEKYLGVKNLLCVSNGTSALQMAYKLLDLEGEVITTPFSFVATTSSIHAEKLIPVFSDIDSKSYNLDPNKIEEVITEKTSAIVPCHVFGNACEIDAIDTIAKNHNLKVIYDASHAFDIRYKNENVLNFGDISVISFHGTKIFHTIEGAAIVINDDELYKKAKMLRAYGNNDSYEIVMEGINAKMNEFEAAMGLCILEQIDDIIAERKISYEYYTKHLSDYVKLQETNRLASQSYSYFPIVFKSEYEMNEVREALLKEDISPRQYFSPSLDTIPYVQKRRVMAISRDIASRVLVIPMHSGVESRVSKIVINTLNKLHS